MQACSATEAILFERTTFLVIAISSPPDGPEQANDLSSTRYERTSELIKALKHSCARMREEFHAPEMGLSELPRCCTMTRSHTPCLSCMVPQSVWRASCKRDCCDITMMWVFAGMMVLRITPVLRGQSWRGSRLVSFAQIYALYALTPLLFSGCLFCNVFFVTC